MFDVTLENVLIEKVAKLAKLYAAGPPEKEFTALKDRRAAISKEVESRLKSKTLLLLGPAARPGA